VQSERLLEDDLVKLADGTLTETDARATRFEVKASTVKRKNAPRATSSRASRRD
jgi:hypothetical protein